MHNRNLGTLFGTVGGDLAEIFGVQLRSKEKDRTGDSQIDELDLLTSLVERPAIYFAR